MSFSFIFTALSGHLPEEQFLWICTGRMLPVYLFSRHPAPYICSRSNPVPALFSEATFEQHRSHPLRRTLPLLTIDGPSPSADILCVPFTLIRSFSRFHPHFACNAECPVQCDFCCPFIRTSPFMHPAPFYFLPYFAWLISNVKIVQVSNLTFALTPCLFQAG